MSPRTIVISIAAGAGLLIVGSVAWAISQAVAALIATHATIFGLLALSTTVVLLLGGARIVFAFGAQQRACAWQAELTHLQNGMPVHVRDVPELVEQLAASSLERHYAVEHVRAGISPALSHFHQEVHAAPPAELLSQLLSTSSPAPQLASPDTAPQLVPDGEWRGWIERAPHLLIAGRTEAGKTTLATAILIDRVLAGDAVLVLDPHYQPGKWAGVPTIGGGNNFEAILHALPYLVGEMGARFKEFERGRPTEDFQRLTVLIDEVPAVVGACQELTPSGGRKIVDPRWGKFAQRLGSEARKVRISVILLTQSTLVQDIQINSQQRDNYLRIGLGDRVPTLLGEEPQSRRRAQLHELRAGQGHPAAMEWLGEIHMLDTSHVKSLAARSLGPTVKVWAPALSVQQFAAAPIAPTERVVSAAPPPPRQAPPTTQLPPLTIAAQIVELLTARRHWMTSTEIAEVLEAKRETIFNELSKLSRAGTIQQRPRQRPGRETFEYAVAVAIVA